MTAAQVTGQLRVVVAAESPQVDDVPDTGAGRSVPERCGRPAVGLVERPRTAHGVHQVVRDLDSRHGPVERLGVGDVALDDLDPVAPRRVSELARVAHEATDPVAGLEQLGDEAAPDVAGGAGDEDDGHGRLLPRFVGRGSRGAATRSRRCSTEGICLPRMDAWPVRAPARATAATCSAAPLAMVVQVDVEDNERAVLAGSVEVVGRRTCVSSLSTTYRRSRHASRV